MAKYKFLVLTNPVSGREAEYNDWYDNTHLSDVLRVPGFVAAQRFKCEVPASDGHVYNYMAIYEIESDNPQAVLDNLTSKAGTPEMSMTEALDEQIYAVIYTDHAPVVTA